MHWTTWALAALFIIVIAGAAALVIHYEGISLSSPSGVAVYSPTTTSSGQSSQPLISAPTDSSATTTSALHIIHTSSNGKQTYSGELSVAACDTISAGIAVIPGSPIHVQILLSAIKQSGCTETAFAEQSFSVSFTPKAATTTPVLDAVTLNGQPVAFSE